MQRSPVIFLGGELANRLNACFTMPRNLIMRVYFELLSRTVSKILSCPGSAILRLALDAFFIKHH